MRINGIGFLNEDGEFQLHRNILESFSIFDDTILFGMFYPNLEKILKSNEHEVDNEISTSDSSAISALSNTGSTQSNKKDNIEDDDNNYPLDFVITPIPYDLWNRAGRLIFRIKGTKQREAIRYITEILNKEGITILNSFSNRSAHSYSTWDAHIAFEKLDLSEFYFQEIKHLSMLKESVKNYLTEEKKSKENKQEKKELIAKIEEFLEKLNEIVNSKNKEDKLDDKEKKYLLNEKKKFDDIINELSNEYNPNRRIYNIVELKLKVLSDRLLKDDFLKLILFDSNEDSLKHPVVYRVNSALHYFHHKSIEFQKVRNRLKGHLEYEIERDQTIDKEEGKFLVSYKLGDDMYDFIFQKFTLRYSNGFLRANNIENRNIGKLITNSKGKVSNILYLVSQYTELFNTINNRTIENISKISTPQILNIDHFNDMLPALTFIEADSHFLNLRIVIIPKIHVRRFVKLNIYYQRMSNPYSSKGLLSFMSEHLPEYFKIWKYHNRLFDCRDTFGSGKLSFFLEDTRAQSNYELESYKSQLEATFDELNRKIKTVVGQEDSHLKQLKDFVFKCKVEAMTDVLRRNFEAKQNRVSNEYDVFISFSSQDQEEAERLKNILEEKGLICFMSSKKLTGGDFFSDKIKTALQSSRELCLLYSPSSKRSSWVTTEWGAAWALNKRITPVLLDLTYEDILPEHDRLRGLQYIKFRDEKLKEYAQNILERRFFPQENFKNDYCF